MNCTDLTAKVEYFICCLHDYSSSNNRLDCMVMKCVNVKSVQKCLELYLHPDVTNVVVVVVVVVVGFFVCV